MWELSLKVYLWVGEEVKSSTVSFEFEKLDDAVAFGETAIRHHSTLDTFEIRRKGEA